jgi:hypothetical protein
MAITKRTIIIVVLAVILFIAALVSLFMEKQAVMTELNEVLNGKQPEDNNKADIKPEENVGIGSETTKD